MQTPTIVLVDKPIKVFGGYEASAFTQYPYVTIQREYDSECLRMHELVHWTSQQGYVERWGKVGLFLWDAQYVVLHLWLTITNVDYRKGGRRLHPLEARAYEVQYQCEAAQ